MNWSLRGGFEWTPQSPDLNLLDFVGHLKLIIDKTQSRDLENFN